MEFPRADYTPAFPPEEGETWIILREVVKDTSTSTVPSYRTWDMKQVEYPIEFHCKDPTVGQGIQIGHVLALNTLMCESFPEEPLKSGYRVRDSAEFEVCSLRHYHLLGFH